MNKVSYKKKMTFPRDKTLRTVIHRDYNNNINKFVENVNKKGDN